MSESTIFDIIADGRIMNPALVFLGSFLFISFIASMLFIVASVNSSRISQIDNGDESEPSYRERAVPAQHKG